MYESLFLIASALFLSIAARGQPPQYAVIDLGDLGGGQSVAEAINASGQVVGNSMINSAGTFHAFLWNGSMHDLGTLGGSTSAANGINDSGQIVGYSEITGSFFTHAFLYQNGSMQDIGTSGGDYSYGYGINNSTQVVGIGYLTGDEYQHAFLYQNGSIHDLGTLGGEYSGANAINASGQIVGASHTSTSSDAQPFLYSGGTMQDLGNLGGNGGQSLGINAAGQVVGTSLLSTGLEHAFLYSGASLQDLGTLGGSTSLAFGINSSGWIVGYSYVDSADTQHAFLCIGSKMYDLNDLLIHSYSWTLQQALAINDSGQIVGLGVNPEGQTHAFLLNPLNPAAPSITIQPKNQYVQTGATATFSVAASGYPVPSYQWYGPSGLISSGTGSALTLSDVQLASAGGYSVVVRNSLGTVNNAFADLIFMVPTSRQPTPSEIGTGTIPPTPVNQLEMFVNNAFQPVSSVVKPNPNALTVIMTHGWNDSPDGPMSWPTEVAGLLKTSLPGVSMNLLAWNWSSVAALDFFTAAQQAPGQGLGLGQALLTELGPDYSQPLHFIGHSLGTFVNASAANYVHGDIPGSLPSRAANAFSANDTQMTVLDEAAIPSEATDCYILFNYYRALANDWVHNQPGPTPPFYLNPIPKAAAWIDNYISAAGAFHPEAANIILTDLSYGDSEDYYTAANFNSWWSGASAFHAYAWYWYELSIANDQATTMGEQWSFERNTIANAPATDSAYWQVFGGSDLDIQPISVLFGQTFLGARWQAALGDVLLSKSVTVATGATEAAVDYISTEGSVAATDIASDVNDAYLQAGSAFNQGRVLLVNLATSVGNDLSPHLTPKKLGDGSTNTPAYIWIPIAVPQGTLAMSFDFTVQGNGSNDVLSVAVDGTNAFSIELALIETNTMLNSGFISMSAYAGHTIEFFLGIVGGTSTNESITASGFRFYDIPPPTLTIQTIGDTVTIMWPMNATNYILETTTDISVTNSWASVTNQPGIANLSYVITNAVTAGNQYDRLRSQ